MPFWVGGTGNITDAANHWAAISGGAPGAGNLPTAATDAIFDANSGANAAITVDGAFSCLNFDMSACAATPTLAGSATLNVFGNFALKAGMTRTYSGILNFSAAAPGKTVTMNGIALAGNANFSGAGGGWTLQDAFDAGAAGDITISQGTWDSNGKAVACRNFSISGSPTATLGASTFAVTTWTVSATTTFSGASSTVNVTGTAGTPFVGGGKTYGTVSIQCGSARSTASAIPPSIASESDRRVGGVQRTITAAGRCRTHPDEHELSGHQWSRRADATVATGTSMGDCARQHRDHLRLRR
jgi:hypothetical protein